MGSPKFYDTGLEKAYVAVLVCFATKAVHLELVSDLTTASFIATLRIFIGRRGILSKIRSDHGTIIIISSVPIGKLRSYYKEKAKRE